MKRVAFYGSLKKGYWNHTRFGVEQDKRHDDGVVTGVMYRSNPGESWYPYLFEKGTTDPDKEREHVVEVYEIDDDKYNMIRRMEEGSGYHEAKVTINGEECYIFYADSHFLNHLTKEHWVESYSMKP